MDRKNPFVPMDSGSLPAGGSDPFQVVLVRGNAIESRHRVHCVVSSSKGKILRQWGDPSLTFFPRSSVKIMQALTWVLAGGENAYRLGSDELAIACASHEGEPFHIEVVSRWLAKLGLKESDLECGAHEPYHKGSARAMWAKGEVPCQLHNNCSGKHSGFLTACLTNDWPLKGYTNYDHPLQIEARKLMSEFFGVDLGSRPWGIDGCGIPTYSLSLASQARAMAMVADSRNLGSEIHEAITKLSSAIAAKPQLIGGSESFSSRVVAETEGRVFAKMGAEGVYGIWIPAEGIGVALKSEDGAVRATEAALSAVLRELGHPVSFYSPFSQRWSGETVGQIICG